jgi:xanthine dehydrogenase accessory factor
VFVRPLDARQYDFLRSAILSEHATAVVTVVQGADDVLGRELIMRGDGEVRGTLSETLDQGALDIVRGLLVEGRSQRVTHEAVELFVNVRLPEPELIMVGGAHIAIALTSFARTLGYRTTVIDPRKVFGSETRFAHADRLIQSWPDDAFKQLRLTRSSAVTMLTHDPKIDDPALLIALRSEAFYVGALGSRKTHAKRRKRLMKKGLSAADLDRVHAPIGLEIGAQTPEEIALAIMAEIVAARKAQPEHAAAADRIATMS